MGQWNPGFGAVMAAFLALSSSAKAQELSAEVEIRIPAQGGPLTPVRLTFDPTDPNRFAVVDVADGSVTVWSFDGGFTKEVDIDARAVAVAISPDGQLIASSTIRGQIFLWNRDGSPHGEPFTGHEGSVQDLDFSPDGLTLASAGYDGTVRLWSLDGRQKGKPFTGHTEWVRAVSFSPDGSKVASSSIDCTVRIWNTDGTLKAGPLLGHERWVETVHFSPRGDFLASAGYDGLVRLWTLNGMPRGEPLS